MDNEFFIINKDVSLLFVDEYELILDTCIARKLKNLDGRVSCIKDTTWDFVRFYYKPNRNEIYLLSRIVTGDYNKNNEVIFLNKNKTDFRLKNLKSVSKDKSYLFRKTYRNNKSGYPGVCWVNSHKRWRVTVKGKYYGQFKSREEAIARAKKIRSNML